MRRGHELLPPPDGRPRARRGFFRHGLPLGELVEDFGEDEELQRRLFRKAFKTLLKQIQRESDAALADVQVIGDFGGRGEGMNHAGHNAELVGGVKANDALRRGRHGNRHPVALFQAERRQRVGAKVDVAGKLAVGGRVIKEIVGDAVRKFFHGLHQGFVHRHSGVVNRFRNVFVKLQPGLLL